MDRRCAGALLALAACIASTAAAPTASNQTALDLYDGAQQGCYYNFQHYGEGDRIMTNEPCLNCTCHNRMLMCYLRVCPFTKPIGQDCAVEKRADQCCPIVTCPDVPVDLLTSTSTTSPAEYGETGLGKLDRYGCSINGKYFPEGAKVPPTPSKPCEHCYCIRNMTTCVMQECTLHVDGCTPIYHKDVCCPVRYSCDHPEGEIPLLDDMTTTVRPTPGFLLTTTTVSPVTQMTQDCVHDDDVFADGALIRTEKACEHCYCMKGDIVCVVQECGTPMENEGKNCTSMPPREGQCCPDTYICEGDELTTETKPDFTTESSSDEITTSSPPRRVVVEGSGYRKEPGEPFTEEPTFESDTEGSGEDEPFKPIDESKVEIPDSETTRPLITTENDDNIDQYTPSTPRIPIVDSEMIDKATTEPDKGENTVPSGGLDEDEPEMSISDKTTPVESKLATESGVTTESYFDAKTTATHDDQSSITDTITTEADIAPTKAAPASETTTADYQSPTLSDNKATAEPAEVSESTPDKQENEKTPSEITTPEDKEDALTTKATDFAVDAQTTESATSFVDQEGKTTTAQHLPEQENEVIVKEPTTESYPESSTKSDIIKMETEPAATITTDVTTPGKEHTLETTSINPIDNEIDEESYPTSSPGRIPGEGDCLLDGITYSNETIVPSNNNCHTSCRCISSIVKCDPIICSAPPDYMDNCQPMYDPPEACCPTYVCDHTKETVPPQSHSQMAGTESPIPTPSVECNGDQCEISKDKEDTIEPTDSSKKPDECGPEGCQGTDKKPDHESHPSTEECVGEKCTSPQAHCANGKCESPITPDQICDSENGCKTPEGQECQGENCKTQPEIIPAKDSSAPCNSADGCEDSQATPPQVHCADGKCESPPTTNQICDSENGCKIPEGQACQGEDCKTQPEVIPAKDSSTQCNSADGCENGQVPPPQVHCADGKCQSPPTTNQICDTEKGCQIPVEQACQGEDCKAQPEVIPEKDSSASCNNADDCKESQVPEEVPNCQGESCTSGTDTKDAEDCKDGSDCVRHEQSPTMEECKEEGCRRKDVPDISKPATGECTDSNCLSLENIPQVTNAPETITEAIPKITELSGSNENIPDEAVTEQKEPDIEKEIEPKITTEASIFAKDDEIQSTTQYDETEKEKEEFMPSITETPEIKTQAPEVQQYTTEITMQKETTVTPLEITSAPSEESSTNAPKLSDSSTDDRFTDLPIVVATEQPLVDDHQTKIPQEDIINDQQKNDLTTSIPTIHDVAADISEDTTAHTERNYPDVDTNTKVPEYVQEQDETQTDSSTTVSSLDGVVPDNVHKDSETNITERDESNTSVTEETSTKKLDEEPIEHEPHETVTTPKSYDGEINFPDNPDTEAPIHDGSEEDLDTHTATPDQLSTLSQEQQHEKEETVQPGSMVTSDEPITSRPDDMVTESMIAPGDESETKSPILPEVSPSEDDNTRVPESTETIPEDELYTKTPIHDTTDEIVVTPSEIVDKNKIPTEAPMSIIKDKEEDGTKPTQASEISVPVTVQELTTQRSASSETSPTESYGSVTEPKEPEMGENVKDSEKESSPGAEEPVAVTEKATSIDESSSEQPNKETKVPEISASDASTDKSPVTVSIVEQPEHPEPSVTEAGAVEPAATGEETSDIEPVTSIPTESIDTKSPESYTEIPKQTISEDMDITPTKDQSAEKEDSVTDIPELTIHEHTESILTTEKSEQFDVTADVATKAPDMLATEPQVISTQKEAEGVPDLQESITNAPDVSATESPKEATEAPEQELLTPGHPLTEPSEYEPKDFTTAIPETPVTEIQKENTGVPEVHHVPTETPEIHVVDPDKEITEGSVPQDITTSDSRISVTEPTKEVSETPEIQDSVTGLPASQTTIMADVSEEEPHKESTAAPDLLDIATSGPEISKPDSDKESSESPSSQNATTKVPEISDAAVTEAQQEASGEPEPQEIATIAPETATQKDVTEIPESQDITTSAPKISVSDTQEEASEAPESQEAATKIPEMLTTGAQKDATEMSDVADTHIPEISVTESQKEGTKASVAPDVATDIPESPATESPSEVTPAPVTHDTATNIPEATSSKTKQDMTEAPVVQDVATEFPETSATESQKEVTDNSVPQDVATNIPEIPATESQKEVTEAPQTQDHDTSITESPATDSPKEATESPAIPDLSTDIPETPVTDSQKEVTKTPVDQDMVTNVPESLATESQKEVTEAPITQDVITGIPEIPVDEFEKEATEAPVAQDAATSTPETPSVETKKDMTQAPVIEDITTVIPETSATKSQSEATEAPLAQDVATSIPEIPATESQKEVTEPEVAQDVTTNISEISVTESQNAATEAPEAQDIATKKPEIPTIETQKEVTEAPMTQDIATNIPEISATESEKETTETPVAQNVATNITDTSATQSQKDVTEVPDTQDAVTSVPEIIVTEPKKEVTESPMSQDVATSIEETSATESQKEVTEAPLVQDITTMIPETSAPESQKKVTGTPIAQDVATSISETPATESQKEITESPVSQDTATRIPETSATESQKEVTESSVSQDAATSIPETAATESQKEVTEAPEAQNIATDLPAVSATESQMELTELPVSQDVATSVPETSATESQKEVTEAPGAQNVATDIPAISATESQKELTESPVSEGAATSIPETSATESQKEVTEAPGAQNAATELPAISATESQQELTESPVSEDAATSIPDTPATESQKEVIETPVAQDVATDIPATSATESQKEVTEAPVDLDVVEDGVTKSQESHVIATDEPEIAVTDSPKYDTTMSSEAELINEQSTKVPESLVTEYQDKITDMNIVTVKPTTSLQDSDDEKPKDEEKVNTEMPILDSGKPDEHIKPEKSDASTESTTSSESVQPDIKSPEEDNVSKSPDPSEVTDQDTKTSEEPTQTSESPETTPYLVLLEEHTHKKDIYTESPDDGLSTGAPEVPSDNEPTTEISVGDVTESAPITDAAVPPKQETVPTEKDESAHVTDETVSEKVTEPSLISEEITTITPLHVTEEVHLTEKPQDLETNEISTAAPGEEQKETDKPSTNVQDETDKLVPSATEKPIETTAPEEEFILATTKATTIKTEDDLTSPSLVDKYGKPDEAPKPGSEPETQKPDITEELPKPGINEVQTTEEAPQPDFPPSGTSSYGQEPDYGEEDQAFGPGTCRYGGKVYVSAQQIPRDDPCDFCFCFRSDIICLQQSCPPPIHGCHEEPIQGFCCPRYECPVSMATTLNVTTTTTTTTTTLPPHFLPHAYKGAAQRRGCQIKGHTYKVGEVVRASSGPCLHCTCGGDGQMKCDPKVCTPEPMLRQMIAAAVSAKRRR